jgi:phospholipase C
VKQLHSCLLTVLAAVLVATAAACAGRAATVSRGACGRDRQPPRGYRHVIWIWLENQRYENVIGSRYAPYLNSLAAACGLATNYAGVAHPSLPNYIAATSGGTWGITDDAPPASHPLSVPSIYSVLEQSKLTWREYEEDAPGNCQQASAGMFAVKHDPAAYYSNIRASCDRWDVPLGTTTSGNLATALRKDRLPSFAFVTPNICDDMHSCGVGTGDAWLRRWVGTIVASKAYAAGTTALFLVWDESDDLTGKNHVPLIVVGPSVRRGTKVSQPFDHYALLKTTLQLLGVGSLPGAAGTAETRSLAPAFGLVR